MAPCTYPALTGMSTAATAARSLASSLGFCCTLNLRPRRKARHASAPCGVPPPRRKAAQHTRGGVAEPEIILKGNASKYVAPIQPAQCFSCALLSLRKRARCSSAARAPAQFLSFSAPNSWPAISCALERDADASGMTEIAEKRVSVWVGDGGCGASDRGSIAGPRRQEHACRIAIFRDSRLTAIDKIVGARFGRPITATATPFGRLTPPQQCRRQAVREFQNRVAADFPSVVSRRDSASAAQVFARLFIVAGISGVAHRRRRASASRRERRRHRHRRPCSASVRAVLPPRSAAGNRR
jgi:hypothetical protein